MADAGGVFIQRQFGDAEPAGNGDFREGGAVAGVLDDAVAGAGREQRRKFERRQEVAAHGDGAIVRQRGETRKDQVRDADSAHFDRIDFRGDRPETRNFGGDDFNSHDAQPP